MKKSVKKWTHRAPQEIKKAARMVAKGVTVKDAMLATNYAPTTARTRPELLTQHPIFKQTINELQEAIKAEDAAITKKMARELIAGVSATATKFFAHEGVVQDEREMVDRGERRKHVELIAKIFGWIQPDQTPASNTITLTAVINLIQQAEKERGLEPTC